MQGMQQQLLILKLCFCGFNNERKSCFTVSHSSVQGDSLSPNMAEKTLAPQSECCLSLGCWLPDEVSGLEVSSWCSWEGWLERQVACLRSGEQNSWDADPGELAPSSGFCPLRRQGPGGARWLC